MKCKDFQYKIVGGERVFITKYVGNDETVVIPSKIENLPVTVLSGVEDADYPGVVNEGVFEGSDVKTVVLPDTLITIGGRSFLNCEKLTKVILEPVSSLRVIAGKAFANCVALMGIDLSGTNVYTIDTQAFEGCTALKEIRFCGAVTEIGARAFYNCVSLQEIALPKELVKIGKAALGNCASVKRITIPSKLELYPQSLDEAVFYAENECALEQIVFEEGREEINGYAFFDLTSNVEIIIPASVKKFSPDPFFLHASAKIVFLGDCPEILKKEFYGNPTVSISYDSNTKGWENCAWKGQYTLEPMK